MPGCEGIVILRISQPSAGQWNAKHVWAGDRRTVPKFDRRRCGKKGGCCPGSGCQDITPLWLKPSLPQPEVQRRAAAILASDRLSTPKGDPNGELASLHKSQFGGSVHSVSEKRGSAPILRRTHRRSHWVSKKLISAPYSIPQNWVRKNEPGQHDFFMWPRLICVNSFCGFYDRPCASLDSP